MSGYRARISVSRSATKRGGGGAGCSASASDIRGSVAVLARGSPFQARDRLSRARQRYVEVGDEANAVPPALRIAEEPLGLAGGGKGHRSHRQVHVDEEHVGLGHGAAQAADPLHPFADGLRAAMVLLEPLDV